MADVNIHNGLLSSSGLDPRCASEALLLKIALEGKDFQKARREVAASQSASSSPGMPDPEEGAKADQPLPAPGSTTSSFALSIEIDRLSILLQTDLQAGTSTASVSFSHTRIDVSSSTTVAAPPKKDPLVFDLDGSGPRTTGQDGAKAFDLAGDGSLAPTSFASGRTAFLALDRNGNGRIDDGGELFGDQHGAADGYEELTKFDANSDRRIDASDPIYGRLQLLFGDGSLMPISSEGIRSIGLDSTVAAGTTSGGDDIFKRALASLGDGRLVSTYALGLNRFEANA